MDQDNDIQFIEYVIKGIVQFPEKVKIGKSEEENDITLISVHVAKEDMGKIVGRNGKTAKALRTLLNLLGAKLNKRIHLKIEEPEGEVEETPEA